MLEAYLEGGDALEDIPTYRLLKRSRADLDKLAAVVAGYFREAKVPGLEVSTVEAESYAGGGTLPYVRLPTTVVALRHERLRPHALSAALRGLEPPVLARATGDAVFVDMRSVLEDDLPLFKNAARRLSVRLERRESV